MPSREFFRNGLTLIELLVALTTLAFVAAIAAPIISQQHEDSQRTHELDNLRILAQLMAKYSADDPIGVLGPIHPAVGFYLAGTGYAEYGGGPGIMPDARWGTFHDPPAPSDSAHFDPRTRPFNHYLYGRDTIFPKTQAGDPNVFKPFQCLGNDLGWEEVPGFGNPGPETGPNSYYRANGTAFRVNNLWYFDGPPEFPYPQVGIVGRPIGRIPLPAQTLALFEARAYETLWTNAVTGILDPVQLTGNHKKPGFFMVNYADGHGAFADMGVNSYFPIPLTTGDFAGVGARGTWGRMDCLPDPPTASGGGVTPGQTTPSTPVASPLPTPLRLPVVSRIPIAGDSLQ